LRQVSGFLQVLRFHPPIKLTATIHNWNIVEIGVRHHKPYQTNQPKCMWSGLKSYLTTHVFLTVNSIQGRIQDFKLGVAHLKKLRRTEGGAKMFGVFRVKNHDFTQKNHIFFQFFWGGGGGRPPPPGSAPGIHTCHIYTYGLMRINIYTLYKIVYVLGQIINLY
jgi:hypothetical protein